MESLEGQENEGVRERVGEGLRLGGLVAKVEATKQGWRVWGELGGDVKRIGRGGTGD